MVLVTKESCTMLAALALSICDTPYNPTTLLPDCAHDGRGSHVYIIASLPAYFKPNDTTSTTTYKN